MYRSTLVRTGAAILLLTSAMVEAEDDAQRSATAMAARPLPADNALNPAMSLILDGKYRNLSKDPETWRLGGFIPGAEEPGPGDRGFGLDESELTLSGNIDPHFYGYFTAAITPQNEVEVEEAHIQNSGLVSGLTIKFGRFFTALGYQNEQHAHVWDFTDLPLAHQAFLGGQLADDGIQLRYVAPTPVFLEVGVEGGKGDGFPGGGRNKNGGSGLGAFVHVGGDVGDSNSYRVGLSYRRTHAFNREYSDVDSNATDVTNAFTGKSKVWALDAVWKWAPNGDPSQRNVKFQMEYFKFKEDGDLTFDAANSAQTDRYRSDQSGWYAQAVFQFMPRWRVGARYDRLDSGDVTIGLVTNGTLTAADFPVLARYNPKRITAMVDFAPSEFSRFRLQYARDESRFNESDSQVVLQYIMSLGAHGAHKF